MTSTVLVTGATGFVGRAIVPWLLDKGAIVYATRRGIHEDEERKAPGHIPGLKWYGIDGTQAFRWERALEGVDCVVHLMGRAHILDKAERANRTEYDWVNVEGTRTLLQAAGRASVRRVVYLSSIGVHGETSGDGPIAESSGLKPQSDYARTKLAAEQVAQEISFRYGISCITLRAPLIYGEQARGNLARLIKWIRSGYPMPFGNVSNKRSLLGIENIKTIIWKCMNVDLQEPRSYVVCDGESLSLPDIIRALARGMGVKPKLCSVPSKVLELAVKGIGGQSVVNGLLRSLEIDNRLIRTELNWEPVNSSAEGLVTIGKKYAQRNS